MDLLCRSFRTAASLGSLEVSRRGTLDFGGGAAGDHRLPADEEVRAQGRPCGGLHPARLLSRLLHHRAHDQSADDERGEHDRKHQVLSRLPDRPVPFERVPSRAARKPPEPGDGEPGGAGNTVGLRRVVA
ncbi:hypothetical protein SGPA1_12027 [Streptomyces misionensis JCM 4497]